MSNIIPIHKKAHWRIPLTVILLSYAILGIVALAGVNIPEFHSSAYLHKTGLILSRWWDPVFLGVLAFYLIVGLYLTQETKHQEKFLKNVLPNAIFGLVFTAIIAAFVVFMKLEIIPNAATIIFLVPCGIYMLFGGVGYLFDRYEYRAIGWKEALSDIREDYDFLDRIENKSAIIGFALGSGLVIGFFPTALIVTGYLLFVLAITLLYNLCRWAIEGVKNGHKSLIYSTGYRKLKETIVNLTGIGDRSA